MLRDLFLGAVLPGLVAFFTLLLARPWRQRGAPELSRWRGGLTALAIVGAFTLAWTVIMGPPELMPVIARDWVWPVVLIAGIASLLAGDGDSRSGARAFLPIAGVLGVLSAWVLLAPLAPRLTATSLLLMASGLVGATVASAWALGRLVDIREDPRPALAALAVWGGGVAGILVLSATASGGQLLGGLVAAVSGVLVISLRFPHAVAPRAAILTTVVGVTSSLWAGYLYAEMSPLVLSLASASPLVAVLAARFKPGRPMVAVIGTSVLVGLPVLGAGGLAASHYFADSPAPTSAGDPYGDDDAYDPYAGSEDDGAVDYP